MLAQMKKGFNDKPEGVAQGFIIESRWKFPLILICLRVNDTPPDVPIGERNS